MPEAKLYTKETIHEFINQRRDETGGKYPTEDMEEILLETYHNFPLEESDGCTGVTDHGFEKYPPCVVHDYLYQYGIKTRAEADKIMRRLYWQFGRRRRGVLRWVGLRLLGWRAWNDYRLIEKVIRNLKRRGILNGGKVEELMW